MPTAHFILVNSSQVRSTGLECALVIPAQLDEVNQVRVRTGIAVSLAYPD